MVDCLVALAPVALVRAAVLVGGVGVGAVLRKADDDIGVRGVESVKKFIVLLQLSQIPSVV